MFGALGGNKMQQQQQGNQGGVCDSALMFVDLAPVIDKSQTSCRNFDPNFPLDSALYDKSSNLFLKSDADAQLIITIGFNQKVRLHHIQLRARKDDSAPKILKIFANQKNMDFGECENDDATQELDLQEQDFENDINLKYVKFQEVQYVTFFVEDNYGGDQTIINNLSIFGSTVKAANLGEDELTDTFPYSGISNDNIILNFTKAYDI